MGKLGESGVGEIGGFECRTKIIAEPGGISALGEYPIERLLLVTDTRLAGSAGAAKILASSGAKTVECLHWESPRPTAEQVAEGLSRKDAFRPDVMVALGNADLLDWTKAMAFFSRSPTKLVTVPTTPAAGLAPWILMRHGGRQKLLRDPRLAPELTILDDGFLEAKGLADSGFEALAQAVEGYTSKNGGIISRTLTAEAFAILYAGPANAGQKLMTAAAMGELGACQAGQGLCRAMAESLTLRFPVSRGKLCAVLLPAVIRCNAYSAGESYTRLLRAAGLTGGPEQLGRGLCRLRRELKLPETLAQAGIPPEQVVARMPDIVADTLRSPWCEDNPLTVEDFMVRRILEQVMGRK